MAAQVKLLQDQLHAAKLETLQEKKAKNEITDALRDTLDASNSGAGPSSAPPPPPVALPAEKEEPPSEECVICLENKPEFAILPCGHFCLCAECRLPYEPGAQMTAAQRKQITCPVCREQVTRTQQIFKT